MAESFRLGVVFTHPTQHHAPLWRKLNEQPGVTVTALYLCNENMQGGDRQLGSTQPWDVDLTSGYHCQFLKSTRGKVESQIRKGLLNPELVTQLTRQNFDAVFLPSFYTLSYRLAALLCKLRGIPLIMQNDATILSDAKYGRWRQVVLAALYPWMFGLADYWISSGDHNEIYLRHYGVPDERVIRGCYPVDRERFERTINTQQLDIQAVRQQFCWDDQTLLYGFVGKYIERKAPFEFINAVVKAHQINPRIRGIMIGGGTLEPEINQHLATLQGEVINVGFVNQSNLPLYYAAMDVFVSTSKIDPHPLVVSEAIAVGTPVILSNRCGNWGYSDTVQHRYNGLVYPWGQVEALAQAMLALTDEETRQTYGQRARAVFYQQDLNCEVNAFLQVIAKILIQRSGHVQPITNSLAEQPPNIPEFATASAVSQSQEQHP